MVLNSTLAGEPIILGITGLVNTVKVLVGGVFGFYILMAVWRFYAYKRNRQLFKKLRKDIVKMTSVLEELQAQITVLRREKTIKSKKKKPKGR